MYIHTHTYIEGKFWGSNSFAVTWLIAKLALKTWEWPGDEATCLVVPHGYTQKNRHWKIGSGLGMRLGVYLVRPLASAKTKRWNITDPRKLIPSKISFTQCLHMHWVLTVIIAYLLNFRIRIHQGPLENGYHVTEVRCHFCSTDANNRGKVSYIVQPQLLRRFSNLGSPKPSCEYRHHQGKVDRYIFNWTRKAEIIQKNH